MSSSDDESSIESIDNANKERSMSVVSSVQSVEKMFFKLVFLSHLTNMNENYLNKLEETDPDSLYY